MYNIRPRRGAFISYRNPRSVELGNGCRIRVFQRVVPHPEDPEGLITTAEYSYSYALGPDPDLEWLLRYDYVPEEAAKPEFEYPVAHVHFNGTSEAYDGFDMPGKKPLNKLHCPTERITLEDFIEHLIIEFDAPTHGDKEEALAFLAESRREFHEKLRTK